MPYRTVLVGTDGSLTAGRAVQRAVELAVGMQAKLVIANVGDPAVGKTVLEAVAQLHGPSGVELDLRQLAGDPADALLGLAEAEQIDAIVVGNKGMAGAQRFLLGSVPNKISHQAHCDVVIVNTTHRS